jgi:hypothetical protein
MADDQSQGKVEAAVEDLQKKETTQTERSKTVDNRLNDYFAPAEEKPQSTVPIEQKPTEEPKEPTETKADDEAEALQNSKNPERTKAYIEKLKSEIEELRSSKKPDPALGESVFDALHPERQVEEELLRQGINPDQQLPQPQMQSQPTPYLNPSQVQNIQRQFVDENGNVDIEGLNRALYQANQQAFMATQRLQTVEQKLARIEESTQVRDAHAQFPEIDPQSPKFNRQAFELVRDRIFRNKVMGVNATLTQVAKDIVPMFQTKPVDTKAVSQEAVENYKRTQEARNQGPFESGRGEDRQDVSIDDLRKMSRGRGISADKAIGERLKRLGI